MYALSKAGPAGRDDEDANIRRVESYHGKGEGRTVEEKESGQAETRFLDKRK